MAAKPFQNSGMRVDLELRSVILESQITRLLEKLSWSVEHLHFIVSKVDQRTSLVSQQKRTTKSFHVRNNFHLAFIQYDEELANGTFVNDM